MTPERWREITGIFHDALAGEVANRGAFLDRVCAGDAALRAEVDAMLAAHHEAGRFGEEPVFASGTASLGRDPAASEGPARSGAAVASREGEQAAAFLPGTVLARRYRIVAPLGRGGMGEVYRADDLKLGQPVALKFLPLSLRQDPGRRQRLSDEVKLARLVAHPNVCRVWDVVETDGHEFLAMEYVDGEDLASLLRRIGRLPPERAVRMAQELCAGLGAVHDQGLLHRDLKPANVMVDGRGRVRLVDFGLAAVVDHIAGADIRSGTPAYMSPEQREGREVTVRSDVYALGLVLYEVFTGQEARREDHPTPSQQVKHLDPAIDRVIERCLERDPVLRPSSAPAVAASLPGADPLAAALAAGETPSPQLVVAAGEKGGLDTPVAYACLAAVIGGIALVAWVADRVSPFYRDLDKPLEVLSYEARSLVADLGAVPTPVDSARGFQLESRSQGSRRLVFWYRQSPRSLSDQAWVSFTVPAFTSGMAGVRLDAHGSLLEYVRAPALDEAAASPADWPSLFRRAGLDPAAAHPAAPVATPPVFGDERHAWDFVGAGGRVHAEAASWRGRPVWFQAPAVASGDVRGVPSLVHWGVYANLGLLVVAAVGARRHLRTGRGDREGARRVALFGLCCYALGNVLQEPHWLQRGLFLTGIGIMFLITLFGWSAYLALEPLVRRRWPDTLVSWTRLLRGRPTDPLVGRHLLVGALGGIAIALLDQGGRWLSVPADRWPAGALLLHGPRAAIGATIVRCANSVWGPMAILLVLALFRQLLKKTWAALAVCLALGWVLSAAGTNLVVGGVNVVETGILLALLVRLGLLAGVAAEGVALFLGDVLMTTHLDAWYADSAVCGILATLALAAWGFKAALGGRQVFAAAPSGAD
jgi:predicted Ser/Thr protein kinase